MGASCLAVECPVSGCQPKSGNDRDERKEVGTILRTLAANARGVYGRNAGKAATVIVQMVIDNGQLGIRRACLGLLHHQFVLDLAQPVLAKIKLCPNEKTRNAERAAFIG